MVQYGLNANIQNLKNIVKITYLQIATQIAKVEFNVETQLMALQKTQANKFYTMTNLGNVVMKLELE